jgi:E3 ubiquitin-protein ligase SspH2
LVELSRECSIELEHNPIPPVVIRDLSLALEARRVSHPGTGPHIVHSMPAQTAPPLRSLTEEVSSWYAESGESEASGAAWEQAINEARLDGDSQAALSSLLGRLRVTAHYRVAPGDMQQRVHAILEQLKSDKNALASCAALAVEGTTTCDDRIALALLLMEETLLHHEAQRAATAPDGQQTLRTIGRGLYKSDLLKDIANRRVDAAVGFVDPTEYILKYWVKLSAELDLPCKLNDMIFHGCATAVSDADINKARSEVKSAVGDAARFERFLANWAPWETRLKHRLPKDHAAALKRVEEFKGECQEELATMTEQLGEIGREQGEYSADYLNLSARIGAMPQKIQDFRAECFESLSEQLGGTSPEPPQKSMVDPRLRRFLTKK